MQIPAPEVLSTFPQPNYIDPATQGPGLLIITVVFLPIVYLVVGLRTFTRLHLSKHFGVDDVFLLIALLPTTVLRYSCTSHTSHTGTLEMESSYLGCYTR